MKKKISHVILFLLLGLTTQIMLSACSTVPYTNRSQFLLTGKNYENELGAESWAGICAEEKESANRELTNSVVTIGKNIAAVSGEDSFAWEFKLFDSATANAFCLPGGKVAVYTGIVEYMDNEAELAIVMGHEIGHAIARHGGERISQSMLQALGGVALSFVMGESESSNMVLAAYGIVTEYGVMLPYSRDHEYESDIIGMMLAAKAGYDPRASVTFWSKFGSGEKWLEFLSTHPVGENRIQKMEQHLPEAMNYYYAAPVKYGLGKNISASK